MEGKLFVGASDYKFDHANRFVALKYILRIISMTSSESNTKPDFVACKTRQFLTLHNNFPIG